MLVSALLTSLGINSGLCVLFFILYSILRKQPINYEVYVPRLLAEGNSKRRSHFNLERLIPSTGWITRAWKLSEEDILSSSGLDAVVFMRVITFSLRVFSFAGIIGVFVLLPVNCKGTQLHEIDFADLSNNSLDVFTISNVNSGSKWLWIHFSAVYVVTIFVCCLLYYNEAKTLYKRLLHLQLEPPQQKYRRVGLFGEKVDLVDHYGKRLEDIEQNVRLEQSDLSLADETRAAFVSFKSRYGAAVAFHLQQSINPTQWVTEEAPEPDDVYWPFFSSSFMRRWISKLVVVVACILLTILFLVPVVVVQGLTNLSQLEIWFPFLKSILTITFVSQVITGYLPSLILLLFLKIVPPIMEFLSSIQGYISHSDIEKSACNKVLWFTIWNIFFATVFSGSVLYQVSIFLEPKNIPAKLAVAVPAQFMNVYMPKYETAGKFWPIVHNSMIFSLVLMHAIAIGIFTLKKLSMASTLVFPLPVLTLLFNEYCRKRFLPIFIAYSAEVLIKKDREEANDPAMAEFFDKLVTAYQDPTLMPIQYSANADSLNSPLISSADV